MDQRERVLAVIPCFNEAGRIGDVVREVRGLGDFITPLVVDDGSSDNTAQVAAEAGAQVLRLSANLGIGGAVQAGIQFAVRHSFDFCVQIDGDGQHPPNQVFQLIDERRSSGANLIVGSRYLGDGEFRSTWMRRFGSTVISAWTAVLFGYRPTDPTSGLRLMDREAMRFFAATYPADFPEPISLALALKKKLKISEVPVQMREREVGVSSIRGLKTASYMIRVCLYIFLCSLTKGVQF